MINENRCISFDSYIKPQLFARDDDVLSVVYLLIPTSNHNVWQQINYLGYVVYLLIPTSNHNFLSYQYWLVALYIFWFLHQTTTLKPRNLQSLCCISFDSYIKPQHIFVVWYPIPSCISFDSYIKPQHDSEAGIYHIVVYLLIPTSNHNL